MFNLLRVNWGEKKVEFVICDDEKLFRSSISKIIDKTLIIQSLPFQNLINLLKIK